MRRGAIRVQPRRRTWQFFAAFAPFAVNRALAPASRYACPPRSAMSRSAASFTKSLL